MGVEDAANPPPGRGALECLGACRESTPTKTNIRGTTGDGAYLPARHEDVKGQGLGWALMRHLIAYAKAEGLRQLHGDVLQENTQMLPMCRQLGFDVRCDEDDVTLCRVTLPLAG